MPLAPAERSNDLDLARRCTLGDRVAQERLFDEQRDRVHLVLFRILGSNHDMEDLAQEAFVAIFRSLPGYRGEASLATWVDRITTRTAFKHLSRARVATVRLELIHSNLGADHHPSERDLYLSEVMRRLYALLDRLDPKYRVTYALQVIDERPIQDVANMMEVSLVAAKNRAFRARRMVEARAKTDPVLREFLVRGKGKPQ